MIEDIEMGFLRTGKQQQNLPDTFLHLALA